MNSWHSDVSYELQRPGFTFLKIDTLLGEAGGDTIWASSKEQAAAAVVQGHTVHRGDIEHIHPIARTHPVTGLKALFVQPNFTRRIVGFSKDESNALLKLLYGHIIGDYDFHVRFKWTENAVAVWDNRITSHVAIFNHLDYGKRHGWRITTQAERPYYVPNSKSRRQVLTEKRVAAEDHAKYNYNKNKNL
ncbi:MAG: hypothetical protein EXX96DRAFT_653767, partial [Benjaminiella poitrasii]